MSTSPASDNILSIKVTCQYQTREEGGVAPVLLYDGQTADNLSIKVPSGYNKVSFFRDPEAREVPFFFTGANIAPYWKESEVYDDLKLATVTDDAVTIHDAYLHVGERAVGSVTLFYFIRGTGIGDDKPIGGFSSDPEVINTGRDA